MQSFSMLKSLVLILLLGVSSPALAQTPIDFVDVGQAPRLFLDTVEATLYEMLDELGLSDQLVDMVVVGSFAYGIARLEGDAIPSDLDVVLYMRALSRDPTQYLAGFEAFRNAAMRYRLLLQERLDTKMDIDIKVDTRDEQEHIRDPDWVGYSLLKRVFYNRADGKPRPIKGYFYRDVFYVFERAPYLRYVADLKAKPRPIHFELEANQLVIYDERAFQNGEHVELLRSLPKQPAEPPKEAPRRIIRPARRKGL